MTFPRVSVLRNTTDPSAAAQCSWKLFFAKSIPIMLILAMDAPSFQGSVKVDATMPHLDAVRQGASIPSLYTVPEERMSTMDERYDMGWVLLREDIAKRDAEAARRDKDSLRW